MEIKTLSIELCEIKVDDDWRVEGYASVFNSVDLVGDTILPGAFKKTLDDGHEIKMYYEHLRFLKPGKWTSIREDEKGLRALGFLTREHSLAKDVRAELRHGTLGGMSIGFDIPKDGAEEKDGGRIIKSINLHEVSFTGNPAEPKATVDYFKSALDDLGDIRDIEAFLRDAADLSKSQAVALLGKVKAVCRSDSEQEATEKMREMEAVLKAKSILDRYDIRKLLKNSL